jgi:ribosomal protein S18 acetylase RimI-like enzyme
VRFRIPLADPPTFPLPAGLRFRDCVDVDPQARAQCHRDAWNHLEHIGLPEARSSFSTESYLRTRAAEGYDPSLDLLVETADGTLVANCIAWLDEASGVGTFEPVGVHVDFRGRGLARAIVGEGLRRLKARGVRWGRVGTAHFNAPAIAAYLAAGFAVSDRTSWWIGPSSPPG